MPLIVDTTAAFFKIREHTKNELVTIVGGGNNVHRWSEPAAGPEPGQLWLCLPVGGNRYRLMTKQNGEFMGVGDNGNVVRWALKHNNTQEFTFVDAESDKTWRIKEPTKGEYVAVGSHGNIERWGKTGDNTQIFTFVEHDPPAPPKLPKLEADPGQIGDVPRLTGHDFTTQPMTSDPVCVGASLVPATLVDDPAFGDKISQMTKCPYYIAQRSQYWSREDGRGFAVEHPGGMEKTYTERLTYRVTERASRSSEETWSHAMTINAEIKAGGVIKGIGIQSSAGMTSHIAHGLKVSVTSEKEIEQIYQREVEFNFPKESKRVTFVGWTLVDRVALLRGDNGQEVSRTEAGAKNTTITDKWPPDSVLPKAVYSDPA